MFLCRWCIRRFESQAALSRLLVACFLLLGLFTRPVAFILSGEMAVAYFKFHAPQGFWPLLNDGEGAVLYCFIFLYLASTGGVPWSFDRLLRKRASTVC
jgi:putative oxidoreductase